jgi:RNA polymerase sigma-70 factor (ECF subfamily)
VDINVSLIKRCKNNERAAFDSLLGKYEGYLYNVCYGYTFNQDEALDMMQEVYIKIFRNIHGFDENRPFLPWLKRIAINTCLNYKRDNKKLPQLSLDLETGEDESSTLLDCIAAADDTEETAVFHETQEIVIKSLQELPDNYRLPLTLRYLENMNYEEIAAALKQPVGTVKNSVFRARNIMKKSLQAYGILEV